VIQGAADNPSAAPLFFPPMERLFEANVPRPYPGMTRTNCNYGDVGRTRRFIFDAVFPTNDRVLGNSVSACDVSFEHGRSMQTF